jgi:uncharacterized protein
MTDEHAAELTPVEARVLGCLMEKQRTTPDVYPMTLNALVQACNQKSSRHPVMQLSPGEVGHTVNQLRDRELIHASFSGRTERYDHKMGSGFGLDRAAQAVIATLMLRGPQTPGELRINAGRMHELPDLAAVESVIEELTGREPPLVVRLPRQPGRREDRYAHLLCGPVEEDALPPTAARAGSAPPPGGDARIPALEAEVAHLREELDARWEATGLSAQRPGPKTQEAGTSETD